MGRIRGVQLAMVLMAVAVLAVGSVGAVTPRFADLHREPLVPSKEVVLKKLLFAAGQMNALYLGVNDLVAALQLAKGTNDPKALSAQLFAVLVGLEDKPALIRRLAGEIKFCEAYPKFPKGFADSNGIPRAMSLDFELMAGRIEKLNIQFQSTNLAALKKEADRVVFALFWTESEITRTFCHDCLNFIRGELGEDLPFDMFTKPRR